MTQQEESDAKAKVNAPGKQAHGTESPLARAAPAFAAPASSCPLSRACSQHAVRERGGHMAGERCHRAKQAGRRVSATRTGPRLRGQSEVGGRQPKGRLGAEALTGGLPRTASC
jgi:hypothetical protein